MPPYPAFIGGTNRAQSPIVSDERSINWFPERVDVPGSKPTLALYPTPGVVSFATSAYSGGRGSFQEAGRAWCVIGTRFFEINAAGTLTERGTVATDANPATICSNGDGGGELFITSGNNGYIYDTTTHAFTQVRTGATTMGAHLDGYFLALDAATSTLFRSKNLDGLTWDPTEFAQRTKQPDPWVSMAVVGSSIWLFGSKTSEAWYNAGTFPDPFLPHPSGVIPYGCAAPFSVQDVNGTLYWLASSGSGSGDVMRLSGFTPEKVSTFAMATTFAGLGDDLETAIGDTYSDQGHTFYLLTVPDHGTWAFDASMNLWAERGTWIAEQARFVAWRPAFHCFAFGYHLMLDRDGGTVYRLNTDTDMTHTDDPVMELRLSKDGASWGQWLTRSAGKLGEYGKRVIWRRLPAARRLVAQVRFTDPAMTDVDGRPLVRLRQAPLLTRENKRSFFGSFELDIDSGRAPQRILNAYLEMRG